MRIQVVYVVVTDVTRKPFHDRTELHVTGRLECTLEIRPLLSRQDAQSFVRMLRIEKIGTQCRGDREGEHD